MANTTTGIPVFYFRPDPSPGTPAGDNDPAYELGNIQNISTTLNPEAVEIIRSHGDAPRSAGMPQVSQSVNYEITISELGILPMLIITGAGGHNIRESAGIVSTNGRSADTSLQELIEFDFTGDNRYDRQRWYRIGSEFMLPTASLASNLVESINPIVYDDSSSDNIQITTGSEDAPAEAGNTLKLWSVNSTNNALTEITVATTGNTGAVYETSTGMLRFNATITAGTRIVGYLDKGNLRIPIVPITASASNTGSSASAFRLQVGDPVSEVRHLELSRVSRITSDGSGTDAVDVALTSGTSDDYTFGDGSDADNPTNSIDFTTAFDTEMGSNDVLVEGNVLADTPFVVTEGVGSSRTQAIEGVDFVVNRSLGLIRFSFQDDNRNYEEDPNSRVTVYAKRQAIPNSDQELEMAQWMVSRYRTTYGRGDLYVYDDEGVVVWGHTQFRCTVWCSGDITFNPTEIATATITVAVETDDQGQTGFQFGDASRLPF